MRSEDNSLQDSLDALLDRGDDARPVFVFDDAPVSRSAFRQRIEETAAWLAANDIGKGDVVAVWLVNRLEWVALLFAAARLGAIVAAVNTRYRSAELAHLLALSRAKMLVVESDFRGIDFAAILSGIERRTVPDLMQLAMVGRGTFAAASPTVHFDAFDRRYPPAPGQDQDLDAPVLLYTTSGTTKGPKLVAHSQRTLASHGASIAKALGLSADQHSLLLMLPLCGTFGLSTLLGFLAGHSR